MSFLSDLGDVIVDGVGLAIDNEIKENSSESGEGRAENANPNVRFNQPTGVNSSGQPISFIQTSAGIATLLGGTLFILTVVIFLLRMK